MNTLQQLSRSKFFITVLIVAVLLYSFTAQVARAGGTKTFIGWILTALSIVISVVVTVFCPPCGFLGATSFSSAISALIESGFFGIALIDLMSTVTTGVGQVMCLTGTNNPFYQNCAPTEEGFARFVGSGSFNPNAPPPQITSSTSSSTCNSVTLCFSVKNVGQYSLYRDGAKITESETCRMQDGSDYSFCYTDSGLSLNTTYKYEIVVTDVLSQPFLYPAQYITTLATCS